MSGVKGKGSSRQAKQLHEIRTQGYSLAVEAELHEFTLQCQSRRHVPVIGCLGGTIYTTRRFSLEECEYWADRGFNVPLDLVPRESWWISVEGYDEIPRFGEEALGKDF